MLGEVRLGFFVDGIGWYKDCSELIFTIDSSSKVKHIVKGTILEVDDELYKVQSVELGFIPYPGRPNFEREKPIKIFYVSRAHTELMGEKTKKSAVDMKKLEVPKVETETKKTIVVDDTSYSEEDFKEEFPHLVEKPKKTRKKRAAKKAPKPEIRGKSEHIAMLDEASFIKEPKRTRRKKSDVPKKPEKQKKKNKRAKPEEIKETRKKTRDKTKTTKTTEPVKPETKKPKRRARCKSCGNLFKSLARHKCKEVDNE